MGYYTNYTITADKVLPDDFEDKFVEITDYYFNDGEFEVKWYDCEDDMIKISKLYPNILFTVKGDGEESGDIWKHYFKYGKKHIGEPEFVWPFDEKKFFSEKKYI